MLTYYSCSSDNLSTRSSPVRFAYKMSFLNSVMASINDGQPLRPSSSLPPGSKATVVANKSVAPNVTRPAQPSTTLPPKRKVEPVDTSTRPNAARPGVDSSLEPPPSRSATASPALKSGQAPIKAPMPYRGVGKSPAQVSVPAASKTTSTAAANPPAKPVATKTGYLAVLARAKAAQEAAKQAGGIKHVKMEKLSRREKEKLQTEAVKSRSSTPVGKSGKTQDASRSKSSEPAGAKAGDAIKKERKPIDVGYKGTMRPMSTQPPAYRGTMQSRAPPPRPGYGAKRRAEEYSDEEDEDDEEEDYDSASDMEAGREDIDEEEEMSARVARQEDLEALREENELKRQKLERKRKLEKLQAAAAAKKPRY